jgi:transcriptional regulator with XRE-family HTH domain
VPPDFLDDFGAAVRRLREQRSMTQGDLAERVGLGRTSMTNLEGGRQNPPLSILPDLANALGVTPSELLAEVSVESANDDQGPLASHVRDDDLRRWASQVIADQPAASTISSGRQRRPQPRGRGKS